MAEKEKIVSFLWQHVLLWASLFVMPLGVAECVRSMLGSNVISILPYVFETVGKQEPGIPEFAIGQYTYLMNGVLVLDRIVVLRSKFETVQLFRFLVGFVFGSLIDFNMLLAAWLVPNMLWQKIVAQVLGCTNLGFGGLSGSCLLQERAPFLMSDVLHF